MYIFVAGANESFGHGMQLVEKNSGNKFIFIGRIV